MSADAGLRVVAEHLERLAPLQVRGSWLHGSLALGGYHHGISDLDLVVELSHPMTEEERLLVDDSHRRAGPLLAASYLEAKEPRASEPLTWTHGWSGTRRVSLITRAELHAAHPEDWPEIPDVAGVVASEVQTAWRREMHVPRTWLRTDYVDLSLTSVARAHLTQETGALCSKDAALVQLERLGVPPRLAEAARARREGRPAESHNAVVRAVQTRRAVKRLLDQL